MYHSWKSQFGKRYAVFICHLNGIHTWILVHSLALSLSLSLSLSLTASQVLVRPSPTPDDNQPVILSARAPDSSVQINVRSSWWLVEDYAAFAMLSRTVDPTAVLGIVDVAYTINYTIQNFMNEE